MCRSYAPLTISRARSLGRTSCSVRVAIELEPNPLPFPTARTSKAALAAATRGSTPSSSSRSRAASISSTLRAACFRLPSRRRSSNGSPMTPAISPRSQSACPARSGAVEALDRGRGQPLHEDRSQQLHLRGVACTIRDDLHRHAERSQSGRECLCPGAGGEGGRAEPLLGHGAQQRDVGEPAAGDRCQLLLLRRGGGVEICVDRPVAERGQRSLGDRHGSIRRVGAQHDVSARHRLLRRCRTCRRGPDRGRIRERRRPPRRGPPRADPLPRPDRARRCPLALHLSFHWPAEK